MSGFEIIGLLGTLVSAVGTISAANQQAAAANYEAQLAERRAGQERAMATYRMQEQRRKTEQLKGQAIAAAASSGGGVLGSFEDVYAKTEERGRFLEGFEMYQGEERAKGLEADASVKRMAAKAAKQGAMFKVAAQGLNAFSKFGSFEGFGGGGSSGGYEDYDA